MRSGAGAIALKPSRSKRFTADRDRSTGRSGRNQLVMAVSDALSKSLAEEAPDEVVSETRLC